MAIILAISNGNSEFFFLIKFEAWLDVPPLLSWAFKFMKAHSTVVFILARPKAAKLHWLVALVTAVIRTNIVNI